MPQYTLNRIVTLQRKVVTRDTTYGSEIVSWADIDTVWAHVRQTGASKNFENDANRNIALRNSTIRIQWRNDVRETSRVVYDSLLWDIKGIAEIGRLHYLDLICQTDASRRAPVDEQNRERRDTDDTDDGRKPESDALPDGQQAEPGSAPK